MVLLDNLAKELQLLRVDPGASEANAAPVAKPVRVEVDRPVKREASPFAASKDKVSSS